MTILPLSGITWSITGVHAPSARLVGSGVTTHFLPAPSFVSAGWNHADSVLCQSEDHPLLTRRGAGSVDSQNYKIKRPQVEAAIAALTGWYTDPGTATKAFILQNLYCTGLTQLRKTDSD